MTYTQQNTTPLELIFQDGDSYYTSLTSAIQNAEVEILIESYIWELDAIGLHFLSLLTQASSRGVNVKILLDGAGSSHWTYADQMKWQNPNFEIRFFHAMPWQRSLRMFWESVSFKKFILGISKFNRRNHRKTAIIDQKLLFLGSLNISACHSKKQVGHLAWRDTGAVTHDPASVSLEQSTFDIAWNQSWHSIRQIQKIKRQTRQRITNKVSLAKKRIWITTPYLIPPTKLLKAILKAATDGLDVKIIIPHRGDSRTVQFASQAYYQLLLVAGVDLYEYRPSMIHAKVLVIDDEVTIGSNNLDYRGLYYDLETSLTLKDSTNQALVIEQFLADIHQSIKITPATWKQRPWLYRILEYLFLLFRRVL